MSTQQILKNSIVQTVSELIESYYLEVAAHADKLSKDPSLSAKFNEGYGPGAARKVLAFFKS